MCYGLIFAIPVGASPPFVPPHGDMTVWRVENPWFNIALGDGWMSWLIGDAHHCSCGRIRRQRDFNLIVVDPEAISYITEAADRVGSVAFLVHWFSGLFTEEEIIPTEEISFSSGLLRHQPERAFPVDCLVWVVGHSGTPLA